MQHTRKRAGFLKSVLLGTATLGAISLAGGGVARADLVSIGLQEAGVSSGNITNASTLNGTSNPYPPYTSIPNYFSSSPGSAFYKGSYGVSDMMIDNAVGTPPNPEPHFTGQASVHFNSGGELKIYLSETGLTSAIAPAKIRSAFSLSNLASGVSIAESSYVDPGNGVFTLTDLLSTKDFGSSAASGTASIDPMPTLTNTFYSLTEVFDITATGQAASSGGTITTSRVPEPGSLALFGFAVLGLGLAVRRRKAKG